jgi:hypothetical protein
VSDRPGPSEHVGDALSALLDRELAPHEEATVRTHVEACGACAAELAQVELARTWLRALPALDPPFGFVERLVMRGRRRRRGAAVALAGAAAASVAFVGMLPAREQPVRPPVASLVRTHAVTASVDGEPLTELAPAGVPVGFPR